MKSLDYIKIIKNKIIKASKAIFFFILWVIGCFVWQSFGPRDYSSESYSQYCECHQEESYLEKIELEETQNQSKFEKI